MNVVDFILDRRDGKPYNNHTLCQLIDVATAQGNFEITHAFMEDNEGDFKEALASYIRKGGFNRDLIMFIYRQWWLLV